MSNFTGLPSSTAIFYAMDPAALKKYAAFKDKISVEQLKLSADEVKKISLQVQESRADGRELFTVDDEGAAHIMVTGPLEPKPDVCAIIFDMEMTTYGDIITATRAAEADNNINKIIYHFDSPGGNVVGLFKTADEIRGTTKPTLAINHGLCASAAFALASQCDEIIAENIAAETGSIGVATEILDFSGRDKGRGVIRHILTSANAENKIPDVTTSEGRDKIISRLTDIESVFVEYVAIGRNTTTDDITTNFGRGGILIARDARDVGMIDSIDSEINPASRDTTGTDNQNLQGDSDMGDITMTDEQLEKFGSDIAEKTAAKVKTEISADFDARDKAKETELKRKDGFKTLLAAYPEQANLISGEMEKEGAEATAEFAVKVANAETARIAAAKEQEDNADDAATDLKGKQTGDKDESGNMLSASLGIKVGV